MSTTIAITINSDSNVSRNSMISSIIPLDSLTKVENSTSTGTEELQIRVLAESNNVNLFTQLVNKKDTELY